MDKVPFEKFRVDCYDNYVAVTPMPEGKIKDVSAIAQFVKRAIQAALDAAQDNAYRERLQRIRNLKDGEPCDHAGCLNHVSHPCEGCGRIAGRTRRTTEGRGQ